MVRGRLSRVGGVEEWVVEMMVRVFGPVLGLIGSRPQNTEWRSRCLALSERGRESKVPSAKQA